VKIRGADTLMSLLSPKQESASKFGVEVINSFGLCMIYHVT